MIAHVGLLRFNDHLPTSMSTTVPSEESLAALPRARWHLEELSESMVEEGREADDAVDTVHL